MSLTADPSPDHVGLNEEQRAEAKAALETMRVYTTLASTGYVVVDTTDPAQQAAAETLSKGWVVQEDPLVSVSVAFGPMFSMAHDGEVKYREGRMPYALIEVAREILAERGKL